MKTRSMGLGAAIQLADVEQGIKPTRPGAFAFLFESCCIIDTQPPLPPGNGGK